MCTLSKGAIILIPFMLRFRLCSQRVQLCGVNNVSVRQTGCQEWTEREYCIGLLPRAHVLADPGVEGGQMASAEREP
jgi:hypothetical protein